MSRDFKQVVVRFPDEFKDWLHEQARENHRTLQGEIMFRLERSRHEDEVRARGEEAA